VGALDEFLRDGRPRALLVAAHPDDETIGAAARLLTARDIHIVHITDGAPRNLCDAARCGFADASEYAGARRRELLAALAIAGVGPARASALDFADQEASFHLEEIAARLRELIAELRPALLLTHPYEGGHPDHDACAAAVHCAVRGMDLEVAEFASYHAVAGGPVCYGFLADTRAPEIAITLTPEERAIKQRMFACFATQRETITQFPTDIERFRIAPAYDFSRPPHPGRLHYERHDWGMTGERFCALAGAL
jgi:LmbE family N-acetylglucosaminyl deacetylase